MADEYRTLDDIQKERNIITETADKAEYQGEALLLDHIDMMEEGATVACMVTAAVMGTGEVIMFSGGKPMRRQLEKVTDALPFVAHLKAIKTSAGNTTWILE